MEYLHKLDLLTAKGKIPEKFAVILKQFYAGYLEALASSVNKESIAVLFDQFLDMIVEQIKTPYPFKPFHKSIREPFDYYRYGLNFFRPLVLFEESKVLNLQYFDEINQFLEKGDNVVLLANHQTEPDPQAISLLLEKTHARLAEDMIFVAGHRVISDPLCAPLSKGRNLLCIFSKKHIENPPELKEEKQTHNQRTMKQMTQLLSGGGKCIYVAPSGGRDRMAEDGMIEIAAFDPQSIELFWLLSQHSEKKTHFYPLSLATYALLPPPQSVDKELGEARHAMRTPIHLALGREIDMDKFPGSEGLDKRQKRKVRAEYIWGLVKANYKLISTTA